MWPHCTRFSVLKQDCSEAVLIIQSYCHNILICSLTVEGIYNNAWNHNTAAEIYTIHKTKFSG